MPDLFLGAAAGPPGLPDWIDHAFPDPVKNDPVYLATAVAELGALFFHEMCITRVPICPHLMIFLSFCLPFPGIVAHLTCRAFTPPACQHSRRWPRIN